MYSRSKKYKDCGLTLLEVLLSLIIAGVIAGIVLTFYISHYRLAEQVKTESELDYSLLRAGQVLADAIRASDKVQWTGRLLKVSTQEEETVFNDNFYLADKDGDGTLDLYREHLAVPNPVARGLTAFTCTEVQTGLWRISLKAAQGGREVCWERTVKQKVCLAE